MDAELRLKWITFVEVPNRILWGSNDKVNWFLVGMLTPEQDVSTIRFDEFPYEYGMVTGPILQECENPDGMQGYQPVQ